ncbi:MAG: AAA domain-containing protein [Xanthomonadaceae bacterium]|nr:AAA domain-containing protein [Rhodospirillaceae bacterium]NIA17677.1 AAA domain-containing protein [Xanthomonadaceae bacterium]
MQKFLNKFTINYKDAIARAYNFALENHNSMIEPEHIFYSLITQKGTFANQIFKKTKTSLLEIKKELLVKNNSLDLDINKKITPYLSTSSIDLIKKSAVIANKFKHKFIGTEHLLNALIKSDNPKIKKFLKEKKINLARLEEQLSSTLKTISKFSQISERTSRPHRLEEINFFDEKTMPEKNNFLIELTKDSMLDTFDPVIARDEEIEKIIQILCRRKKNNPLLLGETGVGKTAIIEGLAKKIIKMEVPPILFGKKIIKLDLGSAIAGTMFRGEFESKLEYTIEQIQNDPNAILFIDEIHNIVNAGTSNGALDAANILKPALSRGKLSLIGATTFSDFKKYIEKDQALVRRFETIQIEEPDTKKTKEILNAIKKYYEEFHKIKITDQAIDSAIYVSERYMTNKFLPDKAIDLIDKAASSLKLKKQKHNFDFLQNRFIEKANKLQREKQKYITNENYESALNLKKQEKILFKEFDLFKKFRSQAETLILGKITDQDIIKTAAQTTSIPIEQINLTNKKNISDLEKKLNDKIIGQKKIIHIVNKYLKRALLNMSSPERPLGSFIFLGPTGVGKTELAKQIAKLVFGKKNSFIKFDMSEFNDKFNASRMIGAPAGYVGYEEGGKLTEFVKHNPYSLILFDEIEKAHPDIFNLLLQILEDGILTDAGGNTINFKNTLVILTSNIGVEEFYAKDSIGFGTNEKNNSNFNILKNKINKRIKKIIRPELLSRLDQILIFNPLDKKNIKKIVELQLNELEKKLLEKNIKLSYNKKVVNQLASMSYLPEQGARAVRKTIQAKIEDQLVDIILENKKNSFIKLGNEKIKVSMK